MDVGGWWRDEKAAIAVWIVMFHRCKLPVLLFSPGCKSPAKFDAWLTAEPWKSSVSVSTQFHPVCFVPSRQTLQTSLFNFAQSMRRITRLIISHSFRVSLLCIPLFHDGTRAIGQIGRTVGGHPKRIRLVLAFSPSF